MTVTLSTRDDIDLAALERVAWNGEDAAFSETALERMRTARQSFQALLAQPDIVIYGVTSGYGSLAHLRLDAAGRARHAARPPHPNRAAFGSPLPERVTRAIVLARLANFVEGHAAISPDLAQAVAGLLAGGPLPEVSADGHGGAGEILALGALFGPLCERFPLAEKDTLALINGSPCAAALVADAALLARRRLPLIEDVFALAFDALQAPMEHLDPALESLWGDRDEAESLAALRLRVEGAGGARRSYQAPVSFRILPRILGRLRRAIRQAEHAASVSLRSVTDNPVYLMPDAQHVHGRVLSNGGFHNTLAWPALDELAACHADLCLLAERNATRLLDGNVSGLPDQLREHAGDPRYLGNLPMVQVGYHEAARRAAQRTFLPGSESGGFGQNDVATVTFTAWRAQADSAHALEAALAPLAMIASQALFVTGRGATPALANRLQEIRDLAPVLDDGMRPPGPALARLAGGFRDHIYPGARDA